MNTEVGLIIIFITIPCIILTFEALQHIMKGLPSGEKVKMKKLKIGLVYIIIIIIYTVISNVILIKVH
ncbi:hypothetical protein [Clostridium sp. UBA5119]|uniref:hypothetical protein n=1 Tax=Clostridium sp. UBA5119 TaxID=1946366 RepID=UPI00321685DC